MTGEAYVASDCSVLAFTGLPIKHKRSGDLFGVVGRRVGVAGQGLPAASSGTAERSMVGCNGFIFSDGIDVLVVDRSTRAEWLGVAGMRIREEVCDRAGADCGR